MAYRRLVVHREVDGTSESGKRRWRLHLRCGHTAAWVGRWSPRTRFCQRCLDFHNLQESERLRRMQAHERGEQGES